MNVVEAPSKQFMVLPGMSRKHKRKDRTTRHAEKDELRLPLLNRIPVGVKNHFVAMLGEFFGTFLFLFFAFAATNVANASANAQVRAQAQLNGSNGSAQVIAQAPQASTLLYISLAFGFSLAVNVWIFFRISGGKSMPSMRFLPPVVANRDVHRAIQSCCDPCNGPCWKYQLGARCIERYLRASGRDCRCRCRLRPLPRTFECVGGFGPGYFCCAGTL